MSRYESSRGPSGPYTPRLHASEDKRRQVKQYNACGVAGLILRRKTRQTGGLVGIYRVDQTDIDGGGEPWAVVCEAHGSILGCASLSLAKDQATDPKGWCEQCGEETP